MCRVFLRSAASPYPIHSSQACRSVVVTVATLVIIVGPTCQQLLELVKLDLARTILVNLIDQSLDIDSHFEFLLDGLDEFLSVDAATTVLFTAHGHKCVQEVSVGGTEIILALGKHQRLLLVKVEVSTVVGIYV